jgi:hypothetical protein
MLTIRDWLNSPILTPDIEPGFYSTSKKAGAEKSNPITTLTYFEPDQFEAFLGGGSEHELDDIRLNQNVGPQPLQLIETIRTETDTRRFWSRVISDPVRRAFLSHPDNLKELAEQGPASTARETVDDAYCFTTKDGLEFATIVEQKRPGIIRPEEWRTARDTPGRLLLSKEIRMYVLLIPPLLILITFIGMQPCTIAHRS